MTDNGKYNVKGSDQKEQRGKRHTNVKATIPTEPQMLCNQNIDDINISKEQNIDMQIVTYEKSVIFLQDSINSTAQSRILYETTITDKILTSIFLQDSINCTAQKRVLHETTIADKILKLLPSNLYSQSIVQKREQRKCTSMISKLSIKKATATSNIDIILLLETVNITYNTIHNLLKEMREKNIRPQEHKNKTPNIIINVNNMSIFIIYMTVQCDRHKMIMNTPSYELPEHAKTQDIGCPPNRTLIAYSPSPCKSFNISIEDRRLSFKISICAFNSFSVDFFTTLADILNSGYINLNTTESKNAPSVFTRNWHIRNFSQGYLITILLKRSNIISLNVMRKLYFIIITSATPNLTVEFNFKLENFMADDMKFLENIIFALIQWNDKHREIINTSRALNTTISEVQDEINSNLQQQTEPDYTVKCSSLYHESCSTLKNNGSLESDSSDNFNDSIYDFESEYLYVKSSESDNMISIRDSVNTLTVSIDEILSEYNVFGIKPACGDTNLKDIRQEQYNLYNTTIQQSKMWLTQLYIDAMKIKSNLGLTHFGYENIMNEILFDKTSIAQLPLDEYLKPLNKHWVQLKSDTFCRVFFKQLGHVLIHTLFSSALY